MTSLLGFRADQKPAFHAPDNSVHVSDFLFDMQATFRKERHGIAGSWQYSDSLHKDDPVRGAALWEAFLKASKHYYPLSSEIDLIHNHAHRLIGDIQNSIVLADLGPGPRQAVIRKTLPIARIFNKITCYCPIDKSQDFLAGAADVFRGHSPNTPIQEFNADYFKDEVSLPNLGQSFALFFGSSISNLEGAPEDGLPEAEIIWQLSRLRKIVGDNGSLLMAYDGNQDGTSILKSYSHPFQIAFGSNITHRIQRDLPVRGNFNPDAWHYEPVWYPENHQLCHTLVCDEPQAFWLGREHFSIESGERFILNNSFKYPVEKMHEWGVKAGFVHQKFIQDKNKREVLHLMQA